MKIKKGKDVIVFHLMAYLLVGIFAFACVIPFYLNHCRVSDKRKNYHYAGVSVFLLLQKVFRWRHTGWR